MQSILTAVYRVELRYAAVLSPEQRQWIRSGLHGVPGVQCAKDGTWYRAPADALWLVDGVLRSAHETLGLAWTWTVEVDGPDKDVHWPEGWTPDADTKLTQAVRASSLRPWLVEPAGGQRQAPGTFHLVPYQREAIWYALERNGAFLDEAPGAGKTVQAVVIAELGPPGPVLVVTKNTVTTQFCRAIGQFNRCQTLDLPPTSGAPVRDGKKVPLSTVIDEFFAAADFDPVIDDYTNGRPYVVVGWDTLTSVRETLLAVKWATIVFDESHLGKSQERFVYTSRLDGLDSRVKTNNRAAVAWELACRCPRRVAMTGTPQPDRRRDWHSQITLVSNGWGKDAGPFNRRYCDARDGEYGWDTSGTSNTAEFLQRKAFFVHKVPKDIVDAQLPKRRLDVVVVSGSNQDKPDPWFRREAGRLAKMARTDPSARALLEELALQEAGARKTSTTVALVEDALAVSKADDGTVLTKGKVVVFTTRHADCYRLAEAIRKALGKRGDAGAHVQVWCGVRKVDVGVEAAEDASAGEYAVIEGAERQALQDAYMGHPGPCVLVATGQAWGTGIDLHDSDMLAIVTLPYSPADFEQWSRRVQRLGMTRPCVVKLLIAEGTVDERRLTVFNDKIPDIMVTTGETALGEVRDALRGDPTKLFDRIDAMGAEWREPTEEDILDAWI